MKRCNELEAVKEKSSASREIDHLKAVIFSNLDFYE